jgi:hypothetical protein
MRTLWRSGPLLLVLGVVWTGCNQSGDVPPRSGARPMASKLDQAKPGQSADKKSDGKTATVMIPAGTECVLTVEGMA